MSSRPIGTLTSLEGPGRLLIVPALSTLQPEQIRGAACVWCGTALTADALSLGRRLGTFMGVISAWFPRACVPCSSARAERALLIHQRDCGRCAARTWPACCDEAKSLRDLAENQE